jgi:hypothetical protein
VIVAVKDFSRFDDKTSEMIDLGIIGCRIFGGYKILKMRPMRESIDDGITMRLGSGLKIQFQAEVIFDTGTEVFVKNRYNNGLSLNGFPETLRRVFAPSIDILKEKNYNDLIFDYSKSNLAEAIYLTDTYGKFYNKIDPIDYQLVRYKYGKEVPKGFLSELVERYPEKVI